MTRRFQDEIDAQDVANEAIMLRAAANHTIMLVEGPDDHKVFINFIDSEVCEIIISYGRENAIGAMEILERLNLQGIICIVDSDFSFFTPYVDDPNIIKTDLHDLETMMFVSGAFDKVLAELGSTAKITNVIESGTHPRELIRKAAHPIGIVRHYSLSNRLGINFEGIGVAYVNRRTLEVDLDELITHALRRSQMPPTREQGIHGYIAYWMGRHHDHWHMVCGHDLSEVFGKALQSALGTQNAGATTAEVIERSLRLAYGWADFITSHLYARIRHWESKNVPYCCLRSA